MRNALLLFVLLISLSGSTQNRDETAVLANARALNNAVFRDKDSVALDRLFSEKLSYGHSSGKIENRAEAIQGIVANQSVYEAISLGPTSIWIEDKTAVTRYVLTANEKTRDGKESILKLHIMLVWTKEKKDWKLIARQAVRVS